MSTNARISFLSKIIDEGIFLDKINQAPSAENINKVEWKRNEFWILVVACSATESVKGSRVVKNGLSALRYLKLGRGKVDSSLITSKEDPTIIIEMSKINPFLILFLSLLIFWTNIQDTKNIVGIINKIPPKPKTKLGPGLSNIIAVKRKVPTNRGMLVSKNLWSFLTNGNAKINNPIAVSYTHLTLPTSDLV